MKKALVAIVMLASSYATQAASYIYWRLATELCQDYSFYYATISQGGQDLYVCSESGSTGFTKLTRVGEEGSYSVGPAYSALVDPTSPDPLQVNLCDGDGACLLEIEIDHSRWSEYVYADMDMIGADPLVVNVPEPTGGLLVLLGLAALALRRRSKERLAHAVALLACGGACAAYGAANDTLISFSTKGPDMYADGAVVQDGECYALVWTRAGAAFEGIAADGSPVGADSRILVFAPVATGGRCPPVVFEIDASLAEDYAGGSFDVYLLDTRLANGVIGGINAKGRPVAVNGWGSAGATVRSAGNGTVAPIRSDRGGDAAVSVTAKSALPANVPKPLITSIRLVGDNVVLTVKNTVPCLRYGAREDRAEGRREGGSASAPIQGAASADEEITIIAPRRGDSGFYSVGSE